MEWISTPKGKESRTTEAIMEMNAKSPWLKAQWEVYSDKVLKGQGVSPAWLSIRFRTQPELHEGKVLRRFVRILHNAFEKEEGREGPIEKNGRRQNKDHWLNRADRSEDVIRRSMEEEKVSEEAEDGPQEQWEKPPEDPWTFGKEWIQESGEEEPEKGRKEGEKSVAGLERTRVP